MIIVLFKDIYKQLSILLLVLCILVELNQLMIEKNILDIVRQSDADSYLEIVITSVLDNPLIVSLSNKGLEQVEQW